ncbi:hypothetical protein [Furfurilactobacillus entadae]|uniref:hypothetical protein n=1 Tax=Furfurilactobacillus entadae TaxID=2922307 RepID=UPI0035E4E2B6
MKKENIRYFRVKYGTDDAVTTSAYEVCPNIWAIPSRYTAEPIEDANEIENPEQFGIYDKDYLTHADEQSSFLTKLETALQEIAKRPSGGQFLAAISGAVPLPQDDKASNTTLQCLENGKHTHDVVANIVIWGPGNNLNGNKVYSRSVTDAANGLGSMVELLWNPDITMQNVGTGEKESVADNLICLLTKALFRLYGLGLNQIYYPFYELDVKGQYHHVLIEDLLAQGGSGANMVRLQPYYFFQDKFSTVRDAYSTGKSRIDAITVNTEYTELLHLKYTFALKDILNIWTKNLYTDVFPQSDKYGDLMMYCTGPDALIDLRTNDVPQMVTKMPLKTIVYKPNTNKKYDLYDVCDGMKAENYFDDFVFSKEESILDVETMPHDVLDQIPSSEILEIKLPLISNTSEVEIVPLVLITPKPIITEISEVDNPTLELVIPAVQCTGNLAGSKATTELKEALDANDKMFTFSFSLAQMLSNLSNVDDTVAGQLLTVIENELQSEIDVNDADAFEYNCPEWINGVLQTVYNKNIQALVIDGELSVLFSLNDEVQLSKTVPTDVMKLKPYLFYQWYAKRYSRALRVEGLLYQILTQHVSTIERLVKQAYSGNKLDKFLFKLHSIASQAERKLSSWSEILMYNDYMDQVVNSIKSHDEIPIEEVVYDVAAFLLNIDQFDYRNPNLLNNDRMLKLVIDNAETPTILTPYLGDDEMTPIGKIVFDEISCDNGKSFRFDKNTGFSGNITSSKFHSDVNMELIFHSNPTMELEIDCGNIEIILSEDRVHLTVASEIDDEYEIPTLMGWQSLAYHISDEIVEIWDTHYQRLLISTPINGADLSDATTGNIELKVESLQDDLLIQSFKITENNISELLGFNNDIVYTQKNEPILANKEYKLKNLVLGEMGKLSITGGENPRYQTWKGSLADLKIKFELDGTDKINIDETYLVNVSGISGGYLGLDSLKKPIYTDKKGATLFSLKPVRTNDGSKQGYILCTENNEVLSLDASIDKSGEYPLIATYGVQGSTQDRKWLNVSTNDLSVIFYLK